MRIKKHCAHCGGEYEVIKAREKTSEYCCRQCQNQHLADRKHIEALKRNPNMQSRKFKQLKLRLVKKYSCKSCGKGVSRGKDICFECYNKLLESKTTTTCKNCGSPIECYKKRMRVFCDINCRNKYYKGVGNPNYIDGRTPSNKKIRASQEYADWRTQVFERDNHTCRECGQIGGKLHADHIFPFSLFDDGRFHLANGRTLCEPCHKKTFTYLRKWKNKMEFIEEWYKINFTG